MTFGPGPPTSSGVRDHPTVEVLRSGLPTDWLERGLTAAAVSERISEGAVNRVELQTSQSWGEILRRNAFTRLNLLLVALGGATLATGSGPDATFLAIAVINSVVGSIQEVKAKRSLDALAVVNAPRARVIRDGQAQLLASDDVVVDDLLDLRPGDQLTADAQVVADYAELDESLSTGESEPVPKVPGDALVSGSWVVAGALRARVTGVGRDSYANRLAEEARRFSLASSELMTGINLILRVLTWLMVVIGPILLLRQLQTQPWRIAVRLAVAGLVGMVPEGLVLLTTLAFLTAAVRLTRRQVLVQELPAVETLARVDALCVDKTGTLTEGGITFSDLVVNHGEGRLEIESALAALSGARGANATMTAIRSGVSSTQAWTPVTDVAFSSARKWSGATFEGHGTWVVGAPEVVNAADPENRRAQAAALADRGSRVLVVARGEAPLTESSLPDDLSVVALVELHETPRPQVAGTLSYFAEQQVTVRVISGDNPSTVRSLAERVGLLDADRAVDARSLPADEADFADAVEVNRVFGRVTPEQKQQMVKALHDRNHTVAMTGDGVNDVLALKDADLGIAMGSGSAIARGVAQVVVLNDDFDELPSVVAEGRRVLANIERVASLFLVKNVYSLLLSVIIAITGWPYPFLPRHLTLISGVAIGIPGFFLALSPSNQRFRPGFLRRVLTFSIMAGIITTAAVLTTYASARGEGLSGDASRTAAVLTTLVVSLWILVIVSRPVTALRAVLIVSMAGLFVGAYLTPGVNTFFSLQHRPGTEVTIQALVFGAVAGLAIDLVSRTRVLQRIAEPEMAASGSHPQRPPEVT
jgi:cation-transporting P-type ATPase E